MSFSDYMASLGATRAPTPAERDYRGGFGYVDMDNNSPGSRRSANYAYGSKFVPLNAQQNDGSHKTSPLYYTLTANLTSS